MPRVFRGALLGAVFVVAFACQQQAKPESKPTSRVSEAATAPSDLQNQLVDARKLAAAFEAYATDHNQYPVASSMTELQPLLVPTYMAAFPQTPFQIASSQSGYTISAMNGYKLLSGSK